jgi:hypothetical protein
MPVKLLAAVLVCAASVVLALAGDADPYAPDVIEPGSVDAIREATTEERFLNHWVSYVPESPDVPSPTDVLGHIAGAPGDLSRTSQIYGYMRALAEASPRVRVETIGTTEEGREIMLVMVADEEVMRDPARFREATARLADPRSCDEGCRDRTLEWARPIYFLNGGLHSTETGSPEMLMELAYRLAVSERSEIRAIRERVIVLINPVSEPDGRDKAVDWYYRYLKGKTDYDHLPYDSPPYWGKYVFHDNNRDSHQRALALTRADQDAFHRWHPQVIHDLHESIPLLMTWTGTGPYNVHMDPILVGEWHEMAFHEVQAMAALGMPGVWTWAFGEGFGHMFLESWAVNHNAIGRGYETFGTTTADTVDVRLDMRWEKYAGKSVTRRTWYRPWPPPRTFRWSLRNNTNYMQTGVLSVLQYTSLHHKEMLGNFWSKGKRAIERGATEAPYAFVIPEAQDDRGRLAALVNLLREHGIEVSRARGAFEVEGRKLPAGTFVVQMNQPYRGYAWDLLEAQDYPIAEAPFAPYDDISWALPIAYGVEVLRVDEPGVRDVSVDLVTSAVSYRGGVKGDGPVYLLRDSGQEALFAARHRLSKHDVRAAERSFEHDGIEYPAGSWIVSGRRGLSKALAVVADELALDFVSAAEAPDVPGHALDLPRLAVFHTWRGTQGAGWVRMLLDQARVPFDHISDDEVKLGGLEDKYDVILYPHSRESLKRVVQGIDPRHGPMPYTKTSEFPSHGTPKSSPDITGGLGYRGVANLRDFVRRGGLLVTLGGASAVPLDGGFVRDVRRARAAKLNTPGIEIRARFVRPDHPLAYGYPEITSVFRGGMPLYDTPEADQDLVVMRWGTKPPRYDDPKSAKDGPWRSIDAEKDDQEREDEEPGGEDTGESSENGDEKKKEPALVVSGGMKGESEIQGKPAIFDIPVEKGRVIAFNFDPIHRTMSRSDFRMVWNVLLNWNDLPEAPANPTGP